MKLLLIPAAVLVLLFFRVAFQRELNQPVDQLRVFKPEAAHNLGYMLIDVNPGMVLISFK